MAHGFGMNQTSTTPGDSLARMLLTFVGELSLLLTPVVLGAWLPLHLGTVAALALLGLQGLAMRLGRARWATRISFSITCVLVGSALRVAFSANGLWGVLLGPGWLLLALSLLSAAEQFLGIKAPAPVATESLPAGTSAWAGADLLHTPGGESIRQFNWGEICMGGPAYADYLFPDGVLLQGLGSSCRFSRDGRLFAAPIPSRGRWSLALLDRDQRRCYLLAHPDQPWELDDLDGDVVHGRHSPLVSNAKVAISLRDLMSEAQAIDLLPLRDLWLLPGRWQDSLDDAERRWCSLAGHEFCAKLALPASLRELDQPLRPLYQPRHELTLDGKPNGLVIDLDELPIVSADGQWLACLGKRDGQHGCWVLRNGDDWRRLPETLPPEAEWPGLCSHGLESLEDDHVWQELRASLPQPDQGEFGAALHCYMSDGETWLGHDVRGRLIVGTLRCNRMWLGRAIGGDGGIRLRSLPTATGLAAEFVPQPLKGSYVVRIGNWQLPGTWQLEHRVSDCGRYLALLPACSADALAESVLVVDVSHRQFFRGPAMLVERIFDFQAGVLTLVTLSGLCSSDFCPHPLQRWQHPPPPADRAALELRERGPAGACHELRRLGLGSAGLRPLPTTRLALQPQAANADGDFILPSPDGNDALWLGGTRTEFADSWLRERTARQDGVLLTASGLALSGVTPSCCWSADGRLLALTHLVQRSDGDNDSQEHRRQWRLWLLDCTARVVYRSRLDLGYMPNFEGFTGGRLSVRVLAEDWDCPDAPSELLSFDVSTLLAGAGVPLVLRDGLWRLADDAHPERLQWAQTADPLAGWIKADGSIWQ